MGKAFVVVLTAKSLGRLKELEAFVKPLLRLAAQQFGLGLDLGFLAVGIRFGKTRQDG